MYVERVWCIFRRSRSAAESSSVSVYCCWWTGGQFSNDRRLRHGHCSQLQSCHIHVQHAVCVQYSLQDETAIYHCHEQGRINFICCFAISKSLLSIRSVILVFLDGHMNFFKAFEQITAFIVLMLLVGQQKGHLACKKTEWWGVGVVICLGQGADLHMAQLIPLPLAISCSSKSRLFLPFWYRLTRVVPD